MATNGKLTVTFLQPRDSREFKAEIGPATTGAQAIEGLVRSNFVEPVTGNRTYALLHQKTGRSLPLSGALVASGVEDGDMIAVTETSAGAGR